MVGTIINNNVSLTCMKRIYPATGWFNFFEITTYDLDEVMVGNDEYIGEYSTRVSQLFNNTRLRIYLRPKRVVFNNISEFKQDFTALLKDFVIKPVLMVIKNLQANSPVEQVHQVILNILATKDIVNKVFNFINLCGETLSYIAWKIRASYHLNIQTTPGKDIFGRDMIFNLASTVVWRFITAEKQRQVDIDNVRENAR